MSCPGPDISPGMDRARAGNRGFHLRGRALWEFGWWIQSRVKANSKCRSEILNGHFLVDLWVFWGTRFGLCFKFEFLVFDKHWNLEVDIETWRSNQTFARTLFWAFDIKSWNFFYVLIKTYFKVSWKKVLKIKESFSIKILQLMKLWNRWWFIEWWKFKSNYKSLQIHIPSNFFKLNF